MHALILSPPLALLPGPVYPADVVPPIGPPDAAPADVAAPPGPGDDAPHPEPAAPDPAVPAAAPFAPAAPGRVEGGFSPAQMRELAGVFEAVQCGVRQSILFALAAAGRIHVSGLADRTGICQKTVSRHLTHLRASGLVFNQREGKEIWYEPAPDLVRYQQTQTRTTLQVTGRDTGLSVTISLPTTREGTGGQQTPTA